TGGGLTRTCTSGTPLTKPRSHSSSRRSCPCPRQAGATMTSQPDSAEVETVAAPTSQKRVYVYRITNENDLSWERHVGSTRTIGKGLLKVGETTKPTARERILQQLGTAYPGLAGVEILLDEPALRKDGTWFGDRDVHHVLKAQGIKALRGPKKDS